MVPFSDKTIAIFKMPMSPIQDEMPPPFLAVVATPIGHLRDMSERARWLLSECDLLLAEDTRVARRLLGALEINQPKVESYFDSKERKVAPQLIERIQSNGWKVCLISDAGTPCISDPGVFLVREAHERGLRVYAVPGPSAFAALASVAGLATDQIHFVGFLPSKQTARLHVMEAWRAFQGSVIFFEAPHRILETLVDLAAVYPESRFTLSKELTKFHECIHTGTVESTWQWAQQSLVIKGEFACMLELGEQELTKEPNWPLVKEMATRLFSEGASLRDVLDEFRPLELPRKELYRFLLDLTSESD